MITCFQKKNVLRFFDKLLPSLTSHINFKYIVWKLRGNCVGRGLKKLQIFAWRHLWTLIFRDFFKITIIWNTLIMEIFVNNLVRILQYYFSPWYWKASHTICERFVKLQHLRHKWPFCMCENMQKHNKIIWHIEC